jgi:hypothetical protein
MKRSDILELELRHRNLEWQIHKLDRRGLHMTPEDRDRSTQLKKQRLATKDELFERRAHRS